MIVKRVNSTVISTALSAVISSGGPRCGLIAGALALLLTACATDLKVGHISEQWPDYPASSIPYGLPEKIFTITTSTVVTGCTDSADGEIIRGRTTVTLSADVELDPAQRYYIYFDSGSHSKNLDYTVQNYDNGTVKSISASIKDQVAPTTAALVGAAVKLAPLLAGLPLATGPGQPTKIRSNCSALSAAIVQAGKDAKTPDPRLSLAQIDVWVPSLQDTAKSVQVSLRDLQAAFALAQPHWFAPGNAEVRIEPLPGQPIGSETDEIEKALSESQSCDAPPASAGIDRIIGAASEGRSCKPPLASGLILRTGIRAFVKVFACDAACDSAPAVDALPLKSISTETIPQLGSRFLVPVHSGYAQDSIASVELNADGMMTKLQLNSVSALGDHINTLSGNAAGLDSVVSSAESSTTTKNQNLASCLAAQASVKASGGTPVGICR